MKSKLLFTILFIVITLIEISANLAGFILLVYIFKPLIVISLILFAWKFQSFPDTRYRTIFFTALLFALLGDVFLMIRGADLFIPGLASFLIMQFLYISVFSRDIHSSVFTGKYLTAAFPLLLFAFALYALLFSYLPDSVMRIAVAIYSVSISSMAWMAWLRKGFVSLGSFKFVFAGATLFMISDSLIAIDRFLHPIPLGTIWVMVSYAAAQYLIVMGVLKNKTGRFVKTSPPA